MARTVRKPNFDEAVGVKSETLNCKIKGTVTDLLDKQFIIHITKPIEHIGKEHFVFYTDPWWFISRSEL